jgi:hypothetical protein
VLLFALAKPADAAPFFAARWPQVGVVCDPKGRFHQDLLRSRRARFWELLRPSIWRRVMAAKRKGHGVGVPSGDAWRLGGAMVVASDQVMWKFVAKDFAEHPDLAAVPRLR